MSGTPKRGDILSIAVSGHVYGYLEDLVATGLYGGSPSEAAERLVSRGIEAIISAATLIPIRRYAAPPSLEIAQSPASNTPQNLPPAEQFRFGGPYHGLYTYVAKKMGVSSRMVSGVARRQFTSPKILAAILGRICEIDNQPSPAPVALKSLPPEVLKEFRKPGKYYGVQTLVARSLGLSQSHVRSVAFGEIKSRRVLAALYAELANIDAKLQASENVGMLEKRLGGVDL